MSVKVFNQVVAPQLKSVMIINILFAECCCCWGLTELQINELHLEMASDKRQLDTIAQAADMLLEIISIRYKQDSVMKHDLSTHSSPAVHLFVSTQEPVIWPLSPKRKVWAEVHRELPGIFGT
jgi:hypothetical protein